MKELISSNFTFDESIRPFIPPVYFSFLNEAHHYIYCALEEMRHTPCVTKEQFENVIKIYDDLGDFMEKIQEEGK